MAVDIVEIARGSALPENLSKSLKYDIIIKALVESAHARNIIVKNLPYIFVNKNGTDQIVQPRSCIRITCLCVLYPRTPHFYIVKLGFTGVYLIFLFLL